MCHQTVCLVARHLEENGIPTVILGSALDIVEHCGVPRFTFVDFPLGNPCGKPFDADMQLDILARTFNHLSTAQAPRSIERLDYRWSEDETWRERYSEVRPEDRARLALKGAERREQRAHLKDTGAVRKD